MMDDQKCHKSRKIALSNGFELFQMRKAVNLHFNEDASYDYSKYGGKVRGSIQDFSNSPARHRYCAVARLDNLTNPFHTIMFLMYKKHGYITERMINPKKMKAYDESLYKMIAEWEETVANELAPIRGEEGDVRTLADDVDNDDQTPVMVEQFLAGNISWLTVLSIYPDFEAFRRNVNKFDQSHSQKPLVDMMFNKLVDYYTFIPRKGKWHTLVLKHWGSPSLYNGH